MALEPQVRKGAWREFLLAGRVFAWVPWFLLFLLPACGIAAAVNLLLVGPEGPLLPATWVLAVLLSLVALFFAALLAGANSSRLGAIAWAVYLALIVAQEISRLEAGAEEEHIREWLEQPNPPAEGIPFNRSVRFGRHRYELTYFLRPEEDAGVEEGRPVRFQRLPRAWQLRSA